MINKSVGVGFGAVYVLVGLLGFTVTGTSGLASTDGGLLLGIFEVNPLHNIVHLLVGALLIAGGLAVPKIAKMVNTLVGGVYLLVGVIGLFLLGSTANILSLNPADNVLHLASAALLVAVGVAADRSLAPMAS
ncbi:MAG: DUF4383 domain-containing protein [Pseudonocardiaceae bacterium]